MVEDDLSISPEDCRVVFVESVVANEHSSFSKISDKHGSQLLMFLDDHPHDDELCNVACPVQGSICIPDGDGSW